MVTNEAKIVNANKFKFILIKKCELKFFINKYQ